MNLRKHTHSESACATLLNRDGISENMFIAEIASSNRLINHFHDHCIPGGHFESVYLTQTATLTRHNKHLLGEAVA